jgi:phosphoglycerate dehydrogenase-like enzyme
MKFNHLVLVDNTGLRDWAIEELTSLAKKVTVYHDYPASEPAVMERVGDADGVLVSLNTKLNSNMIQHFANVKYIGMCCSLYNESSSNVSISAAREKNIMVKGIKDYGDEGVIEFILSELIRLAKGLGDKQWKEEPVELCNRKLGIIGMGTTGTMLANAARAFGMKVFYYSRNRKIEAEKTGASYLPLKDLLKEADIVSTHLPRNTFILNDPEFECLGSGKIVVNTSLGLTFDKNSFLRWINQSGNYAIFDADGCRPYLDEFETHERIITTHKVAGRTAEAIDRLSVKVIDNIKDFLSRH